MKLSEMFGKNNPFYGKKHSEESKNKMRLAKLGKRLSEEQKKKMSIARLKNPVRFWEGKKREKHSMEAKKKMSLAHIGLKQTKETIEKRTSQCRGNRHYNWRGGITNNPYSVDWTNSLRISIRERDKYTCKICGDKQGDIAFCVHHIDYDKKNCCPDNLITLCQSCHSKTNQNREQWIVYFIKNLQ